MIDRTSILAVKYGIVSGLKLDPDVEIIARDGSRTVLFTLRQGDPFTYTDSDDGTVTVTLVESGEVTRERMMRLADFVLKKNGVEQPFSWANGTKKQWTEASRRVWKLKDYRPAGPLPVVVPSGFPYTFPITFE